MRLNWDMVNASRERTRPGPSATRECNAMRIIREGSWPPSVGAYIGSIAHAWWLAMMAGEGGGGRQSRNEIVKPKIEAQRTRRRVPERKSEAGR